MRDLSLTRPLISLTIASSSAQRIAPLEAQITEPSVNSTLELDLTGKIDEKTKLLTTQVRLAVLFDLLSKLTDLRTVQDSEVEALVHRSKQFSDYDEIKRELEIMKACNSRFRLMLLKF